MDLRAIFINTIDIDYEHQSKPLADLQPFIRGMWNSAMFGDYDKPLSEYLAGIEQNSTYDEIEDKMFFQSYISLKEIVQFALQDQQTAKEEWHKVKSIIENDRK